MIRNNNNLTSFTSCFFTCRKPYDEIRQLAINAKNMLIKWKECYMITRKKIEMSGKGARWEFDRRRLFHRTDYLAGVCKDLNEVSKVCYLCFNKIILDLENIIFN